MKKRRSTGEVSCCGKSVKDRKRKENGRGKSLRRMSREGEEKGRAGGVQEFEVTKET